MGRTRRGFTSEYKDEAVKLAINTGRKLATVARELDIQESTSGRWAHDFRARAEAGQAGQGGLSELERGELPRLRRENLLADPNELSRLYRNKSDAQGPELAGFSKQVIPRFLTRAVSDSKLQVKTGRVRVRPTNASRLASAATPDARRDATSLSH